MPELTIPHAIEKLIFRLGLICGGHVSLAEIFVELPLCLEIVDEHATELADGRTLLKDEVGEYCAFIFPEFSSVKQEITPRSDCPVCGGTGPSKVTVGGAEVRARLVCDTCYRTLGRLAQPETAKGLGRLKKFFTEPDPDLQKIARMEHEIFFHGLSLGGRELTHTAIATQTRFPMAEVKERLQFMGARRYLRFGLTSNGEAVAYSFPETLSYAEPHFRRFNETMDLLYSSGAASAGRVPPVNQRSRRAIDIGVKSRGRGSNEALASSHDAAAPPPRGVSFEGRIVTKRSGRRQVLPTPEPSKPETSSFKIVVKKKDDEVEPIEPHPRPPSGRTPNMRIQLRAAERSAPAPEEQETSLPVPEDEMKAPAIEDVADDGLQAGEVIGTPLIRKKMYDRCG